jgi:hypothetical protein
LEIAVIYSNFYRCALLLQLLLQLLSGPNLQHADPIDIMSFRHDVPSKTPRSRTKNIKRKTKASKTEVVAVLYAKLDTLYVRALVHFIPKEARSNVCDTLANTKKRRYFFYIIISPPALLMNILFASGFLFRSSLTIVTQIDNDEEKPNWLSLPDHPKSFGSLKR